MRHWIIRLLPIAVALALLVAMAPGIEEQRFSCHKCRNLKYVTTRSFLFVRGTPTQREEIRVAVPNGHIHEWWLYSTFKSQGIGGWLDTSVGCQPTMFKDANQAK